MTTNVNRTRLLAAAANCRSEGGGEAGVMKVLAKHGLKKLFDCQDDDAKTEAVVAGLYGTDTASPIFEGSFESAHGELHDRAYAKFNNKKPAEPKPSAAKKSFDEIAVDAYAKWNSAGTALK
jgi:hypothetical protein